MSGTKGKSGRPPKATHLKILEGVREDRVNRDEPTPEGVVAPPVQLSEGALAVWNRLAPDLIDKHVLTSWDVDQFAIFCDALAIYEENKRQMGGEYVISGSMGGLTKSPHWQVMRDCQAMIAQIGSRYGMSPADRARLMTDSSEQDGNGAERLLS